MHLSKWLCSSSDRMSWLQLGFLVPLASMASNRNPAGSHVYTLLGQHATERVSLESWRAAPTSRLPGGRHLHLDLPGDKHSTQESHVDRRTTSGHSM